MSTLAITITRQVAEQMSQALLTLAARQADITTAESVAQRLSSAGVPAEANGRADGCAIHVWVKVGPVNPLRLTLSPSRSVRLWSGKSRVKVVSSRRQRAGGHAARPRGR